ncbi:MAG: hypothetical protein DME25_15275 [Verrucomicrobia bacterium]|nr:MAG: hypothetical protein DME25_15275 [Verrucomicrobiota bacterium]
MNREELFDKFLQRSLTRPQAEELKRLLRDDPAAGRALVEHINEASLVVRVGSQLQSLPTAAAQVTELRSREWVSGRARRRVAFWKWAALAAGLAALALAARSLFPIARTLRATVVASNGEVAVLRAEKSVPAETGLHLQQGDIVQVGQPGRAVVVFDGEATRAELQGGGQVKFSASRRGKRLELLQGALEAAVAPQPKGRPMILSTLHAEARVVGTRLLLASEVSSTRLEVSDGAVEFTRRSDGQSLLVKNGFTAIASPNTEFCALPFLPAPWRSQDIGAVGLHGQARFDGTAFRVRGAGQDTCCRKDQFHFLYQTLDGDGEIRACVREVEFTDPEAKAVVMIRQSLKTASPQVSLGLLASGGLELEHRARLESRLERPGHAGTPSWLRLVRQADVITAYQSTDGSNWTSVGSHTVPMSEEVYVGLGVTSFNHSALSTSLFDNVSVLPLAAPAAPAAPN